MKQISEVESRKNGVFEKSPAATKASQSKAETDQITGSSVPILRSFMVLREERFGGYVFNPYMPPETKLDRVRFRIATLCNGTNTVNEIETVLEQDLAHSREYIRLLVKDSLKQLDKQLALFWKQEKLPSPKNFGFKTKCSYPDGSETPSAPLFVIWEITSACNLRCEHCLSDAGKPTSNELTTSEAKGVIDALSNMKVFNINFSGGEPLMRADIFEILKYASEKRIGIDLLTNGGLISEKVLDNLEDTNIFNVQVSVDGIGETHDRFRGLNGSYSNAVMAIELLLKRKYNVGINSVVTKENLREIPKIIDKAVELGVSGYKTTLFMPTGRGKSNIEKLLLSVEDVKDFTLMIIEKKKEVGEKINISTETEFPWLIKTNCKGNCSGLENQRASKVGCTAGSTSLYITSDGKIAPCPFLRQIIAGDARNGSFENIWTSSTTFSVFRNIKRTDLKGKCSNCEYLGVSCFGGCRAAALAHTGDLYAEDPTCWKHLA